MVLGPIFGRTTVRLHQIVKHLVPQGGPIKIEHFQNCITPVCDDVGRRSVYQNVKIDILNVAIFKYSLHNFTETIRHQ